MAKPKQNIQWAPGTRLQRMNREDGQYEYEMELLRNKPAPELTPKREQPFVENEWVWMGGEITQLGKVDPNGSWVMWRNAKVDVSCFKKLPTWFLVEYTKLLNELEGSTPEYNGNL